MNGTTNVRNLVFLTLQKRPLLRRDTAVIGLECRKSSDIRDVRNSALPRQAYAAPAQQKTLGLPIRNTESGNSLSAIFPVFGFPVGNSKNDRMGTDWRKGMPGRLPARYQIDGLGMGLQTEISWIDEWRATWVNR